MKERYENWKELKPLTAPVPVGTTCVFIAEHSRFERGQIVTIDESNGTIRWCISISGSRHACLFSQLALLPSEEPAKAERKIVSSFCDLAGYVHAVCDDGTMWYLGKGSEPKWYKTPPIPQDAV